MKTLSEPRVLSVGQLTAPSLRVDVEMSAEVPSISPQAGPDAARCVWLLVSVHTEVVGSLILEIPREGLSGAELTAAIMSELGGEISPRLGGGGHRHRRACGCPIQAHVLARLAGRDSTAVLHLEHALGRHADLRRIAELHIYGHLLK